MAILATLLGLVAPSELPGSIASSDVGTGLWAATGTGDSSGGGAVIGDRTASRTALGLRFEENAGQYPDAVEYAVRASGYTALLGDQAVAFELDGGAGEPATLTMTPVAADGEATVEGLDQLPGTSNYLLGNDPTGWLTDVRSYARVAYRDLWPGTDLVLYESDAGLLRYDFLLAAGADPDTVAFALGGARSLSLSEAGDLLIETSAGQLRQEAPVAYQDLDGGRREVAVRFVLDGERVGFELGHYDRTRPLVIDPALSYSTYLGGPGHDAGHAIAVDGSGSAYLAGQSCSVGSVESGSPEQCDVIVTKVTPDGREVEFSTVFGGGLADIGLDIAVESSCATACNAYVAGSTASPDFPTSSGAFQRVFRGGTDAFVAKLAGDGSGLVYSSFLGGTGADGQTALTLDGDGSAYLTGSTVSLDFPTTLGAYDQTCGTDGTCNAAPSLRSDAFVTKVSPGGDALTYSTFFGGSGSENTSFQPGIAIDGSGNAYLIGQTLSSDLPTLNAFREDQGGTDAFITKLNADGSDLVYSTYFGGSQEDATRFTRGAIDVDPTGSAYVTGGTSSSDGLGPGEPSIQGFGGGDNCGSIVVTCDAFVAKLTPAGSGLSWWTYLGGPGNEHARAIAVDSQGGVHVAGATDSDAFPTVRPLADRRLGMDGFVAQITSDGSRLVYSSHFGGTDFDRMDGLAIGPSDDVYLTGETRSHDFPTRGAVQPTNGGDHDAFLVRIGSVSASAPVVTGIDPRSGPTSGGTRVVIIGIGFNGVSSVSFGDEPAQSFSLEAAGRIVAISPPHTAGPSDITVRTAGGTSGPNPIGRFLYADGLWTPTGSLATGRAGHTATLLPDGTVLVAGGTNAEGDALATAEIYDPKTGTWHGTSEPMNEARSAHTATLLAGDDCGNVCGKVLVVGGRAESFVGGALGTAELYDPTDGSWTPTDGLDSARFDHTATLLPTGEVLVAGGSGRAEGTSTSAELYDPTDRIWSPTDGLEEGRWLHTATLLDDGKVLVTGGYEPQALVGQGVRRSAELYDPGQGQWSTTSEMNGARYGHSANRLDDGRIIVAGGTSHNGGLDDAEVYDPTAGEWTATGIMEEPRIYHSASALPGGRILIAGGLRDVDVPHDTGELHDPDLRDGKGDWLDAGLMGDYRGASYTQARAQAVLLSSDATGFEADGERCGDHCGKVLMIGGQRGDFDRVASTELYTPAPDVTRLEPAGGPADGGTEVVIEGMGFTHGVHEVRFGDRSVACPSTTCQAVDYHTLKVSTPPAGNGMSVPVVVMNEGGSATAPEPFVYTGTSSPGDPSDGGEGDPSGDGPVDQPDVAPGRVSGLSAVGRSSSEIELMWSAAGSDGDGGPPAGEYVVKQSTEPIGSEADFESAFTLCGDVCRFAPTTVGEQISLSVTGLEAETRYFYAVKAVDSAGNVGERSDTVSAATLSVDGVRRVFGAGRIQTAVELSREAFPGGTSHAVVARADDFPDALAASTLAGEVDGPVLLSESGRLSGDTAAELSRLGADTVYLAGGTAALSQQVADDLRAMDIEVIRVAGADRVGTAAAIARRVAELGGRVDAAVVARADGFADALAAGPLAAYTRSPVLLTHTHDLPDETLDVLGDVLADGGRITIAGGTAAVGQQPQGELEQAGYRVERLAGADRYATAVELADAAVAAGASRSTVFTASGTNFPDALAAAPAAWKATGVLVLADPTDLDNSGATRDWLTDHANRIDQVLIAGGPAAVSNRVEDQLASVVSGS